MILSRSIDQKAVLTSFQLECSQLFRTVFPETFSPFTICTLAGAGWVGQASKLSCLKLVSSYSSKGWIQQGCSSLFSAAAEGTFFHGCSTFKQGAFTNTLEFGKGSAHSALILEGCKLTGRIAPRSFILTQIFQCFAMVQINEACGGVLIAEEMGSFGEKMIRAGGTSIPLFFSGQLLALSSGHRQRQSKHALQIKMQEAGSTAAKMRKGSSFFSLPKLNGAVPSLAAEGPPFSDSLLTDAEGNAAEKMSNTYQAKGPEDKGGGKRDRKNPRQPEKIEFPLLDDQLIHKLHELVLGSKVTGEIAGPDIPIKSIRIISRTGEIRTEILNPEKVREVGIFSVIAEMMGADLLGEPNLLASLREMGVQLPPIDLELLGANLQPIPGLPAELAPSVEIFRTQKANNLSYDDISGISIDEFTSGPEIAQHLHKIIQEAFFEVREKVLKAIDTVQREFPEEEIVIARPMRDGPPTNFFKFVDNLQQAHILLGELPNEVPYHPIIEKAFLGVPVSMTTVRGVRRLARLLKEEIPNAAVIQGNKAARVTFSTSNGVPFYFMIDAKRILRRGIDPKIGISVQELLKIQEQEYDQRDVMLVQSHGSRELLVKGSAGERELQLLPDDVMIAHTHTGKIPSLSLAMPGGYELGRSREQQNTQVGIYQEACSHQARLLIFNPSTRRYEDRNTSASDVTNLSFVPLGVGFEDVRIGATETGDALLIPMKKRQNRIPVLIVADGYFHPDGFYLLNSHIERRDLIAPKDLLKRRDLIAPFEFRRNIRGL